MEKGDPLITASSAKAADNNVIQDDLVSVIVPVYNTEQYLSRCLDSILSSTYPNIEVICVDDASTDGSISVLKQYAEADRRIVVIQCGQNGGQAVARNRALDTAKGAYYAFVDSDDDISNTFIEALYRQINKNGSDVAVCGFRIMDESTGEQKDDILKAGKIPLTEKEWWELYRHKHTAIMNCLCNKLYKAECFRDKRLKPGIIYEDTNIQHYLLSGKTISVVPEALYYYRRRQGSTTKTGYSEKSFFRIQSMIDRAVYFSEKGWKRAKTPALQDAIKFLYHAIYDSNMDRRTAKEIGKKYRIKIKSMMSIHDWITIRQKVQCVMILYIPDIYNRLRKLA